MAHRDRDLLGADGLGPLLGPTVERDPWAPPATADHLDVLEVDLTEADAESLHHGLLGGEAPRQRAVRRLGGAAALEQRALGGREEPLVEPGAARHAGGHPLDRDQVDADADDRCGVLAHSTVTVLARFLGRSTSRPRARARW